MDHLRCSNNSRSSHVVLDNFHSRRVVQHDMHWKLYTETQGRQCTSQQQQTMDKQVGRECKRSAEEQQQHVHDMKKEVFVVEAAGGGDGEGGLGNKQERLKCNYFAV